MSISFPWFPRKRPCLTFIEKYGTRAITALVMNSANVEIADEVELVVVRMQKEQFKSLDMMIIRKFGRI